jgi:hypothetical protein
MTHKKLLYVPPVDFDQCEAWCAAPTVERLPEEQAVFDQEVVFDDGMRMAIQVCSTYDSREQSCWSQGVLFDPTGNEIDSTMGETFGGEFYCRDEDENDYIVEVLRGVPADGN